MYKHSKRLRVTALCTLVAAAIVATPVVALTGLVSASPAAQDQILYYQTKSSTYVQYVPVSGTTVTQTLSAGTGTCPRGTVSNPAPSPASGALLPLSASYYAKGYSGTPAPASVGTFQYQTGVCSSVGTGWSVGPNEGLVFSIGPGNPLTQGRVFSQATIPLERFDSNRGSLSGDLLLRRMTSGAEATVGTVPFTLARADGDDDADDIAVVNTGVFTAGFDQLEVQVNSPSTGAVSVVGPASNGESDGGDGPAPAVEATFYLDSAPTISGATNTTFTVGTPGSMTVTASGYPTPALSDASTATCTTALPGGVSFSSTSGSGSAKISGTPGAGTGGTYNVCITASNANSTLTKTFTLTVNQAPAITSPDNTTFSVGGAGSFSVIATGVPTPTVALGSANGCTQTSPLPSGLTLSAGGTLSDTPGAGDVGTYTLCITASNGVSPAATQAFKLTVNEAPAITSGSSTTFTAGNGLQSFAVTTTGSPTPTVALGSANGCTQTSSLPSDLSLSAAGTLSETPVTGDVGTYNLCITASNGVSPPVTQAFKLTVNEAPAITSGSSTTFTAGNGLQSFAVTTTGSPTPTVALGSANGCTQTSPLPSDLSLSAAGTLSETPVTGDVGTYNLCITASNGVTPAATQSFTLTVDQAPAITSSPTDIVPAGTAFIYSVTTTGNPTATITNATFGLCNSSTLPGTVSFIDNGDGTATISGTPANGDAGTYTLCLKADNGVSPAATQQFTLVITAPGAPFDATPQNGSPVAANIQINTGSKSFVDFTTSGAPGSTETVNWDTTQGTGTYNATAVLTWVVPYCTPGTDPTECGPTDIAFTVNGAPQPQTFCLTSTPPSDPTSSSWCTTNISYAFLDPGHTGKATETQITETWNGQGDPTWSRG